MAKAVKAAQAEQAPEAAAADKPKRVRKTAAADQAAPSKTADKPKTASRTKSEETSPAADLAATSDAAKPAPKPRAKAKAAETTGSDKAAKPRTRKAATGAAVSAAATSTEVEATVAPPATETNSVDLASEPPITPEDVSPAADASVESEAKPAAAPAKRARRAAASAKTDEPQAEAVSVAQDSAPEVEPVAEERVASVPKKPKAKTAKAAPSSAAKAISRPRTRKAVANADQSAPDETIEDEAASTFSSGVTTNTVEDPAEVVLPATNTVEPVSPSPVDEPAPAGDIAEPAAADKVAQPDPQATTRKSASADKPWLASYPPNVPTSIPALPADSLGDLMVNACKRYAGRIAFSCMGREMKFVELEEASAAFGAYLQAQGLAKGARIALMMPNVLQYPIALMGALRAGYTVVNVNPLYTARELEHQLKDAGAEAIVILENFAHTLESVIGNTPVKHVVVASLGDLLGLKGLAVNLVVRRVRKMVPNWTLKGHVRFNAALKAGRTAKLKPVAVTAQDLAFLQYTGGTTGISKGAMLSHANVLSNIAQNAAWLESAYIKRQRPEKPVFVCALPLYHIYALTVNALMGMQQGAHNVLITNPRDIAAFTKELRRTKFNILPGLNTLFNALLNNKDFQNLDFSSLVLTFGGGMAVQPSVAERWQKLTGSMIAEGYGLSETSPVATANRFDADQFSGTIGLPLPSTEVSIRDENGVEVALGEVGEICIRGPQVMSGYWNRPDETAKVMTADGFLKSGDIGFMNPQGYTKIVDRKKDMILVSGFNVYPNEIEEVVARHPKVLEVAAIGVTDEKSGEVPKLFVVKKDESLSEEELREFCRENLTGYKRPRHFEFREDLPKTAVGKILRRDLRD